VLTSTLFFFLVLTDVYNSLKLIRGSLDEVERNAQITWVQPRVLSLAQIGELSKRLDAWGKKLQGVEQRLAPEVVAQ
jgi:26S proteasome regulatory subunit N9